MRTCSQTLKSTAGLWLTFAIVLAAGRLAAADADDQPGHSGSAAVAVTSGGGGGGFSGGATASGQGAVVISSIEPATGQLQAAQEDRTWLGVGVEEGSEVLASQLGLAPGVGLVVTFVAPESPAAKAGLLKNDVLAELDSQLLVLPAQLRKLVQGHKAGDVVELVFYRAGKRQTASATLGKTPATFRSLEDGPPGKGGVRQFYQLFPPDARGDQLKTLRDSLGQVKMDQTKVTEEVRRGMEQARKAWQDAFRYSSNAALVPALKALRELQRSGIDVDNNASVTVRSGGHRVKSLVKADESGTMVLVCNPKPHLTAHDPDGKLLFDGEIDTPEQRAKIPPELWEKAEPLLDKLATKAEDEPATKPAPPKRPALPNKPPAPPMPPRPGTSL